MQQQDTAIVAADAEMNFKEVIRREIVEKISSALDIVYS